MGIKYIPSLYQFSLIDINIYHKMTTVISKSM